MHEEENHVKEVILKPYYLIDRILKMPNLPDKYYFGLRLDENANWLDYIFALFCLSLFHRFDSRSFFDVDLLISSYLLYSQPDVVIDHLDALKLTKEEKNDHITFISLINHHAKRLGYGEIIEVNKWSEEDAYLCLQRQQFLMDDKMVSMMNFVFKKLQKSYEDVSFEMLKIFIFPSDELVTESIDYLNKYFQEEKEKSHKNYHKWSYLWRNLAGELAPWNCNPNEKIYYKRDQTSCVSFCPFKLKRDYKHNQHIDASVSRDTGSRVSGAEMAEIERQKRLQMYSNEMPIDLLVINNVHDKNNTIGNHNLKFETFEVSLISPKKVKDGFLKITADSIVMQIENSYKIILGEEIEHIFFRRRFHRPNSIEIFTIFGKNYFIHFPKHNSLSIISKIQSTMTLPNIKTLQTKDFYSYFKSLQMTELWQNHLLSNFDYLMSLNILSGRTFNDLSQYPVFPWITANHLSETVQINDKNFFRDFSKPIGALTDERLNEILKRVPDLALVGEKPYMYGNGYSCMLTVCLFMLRTEPFTSLHIDLQSGRFDHASRIFSSIETTWEMISSHVSDYRESIPEFFFFPEFLMNLNEFDLGKNKRGPINDVELPKWSKNAYEFVYLNRKILESEYVSQHINGWIDLIWGYNSRGENAVKHNNVFKQEMYDSAWTEKTLNNSRQRSEIEATLCHVGQMCPQLFFHPHPLRNMKSKYKKFERNINVNLSNMSIVLARINAENDLIKVSMTESKGKTFIYYFDLGQEVFNEKTDVTFLNKEFKNFEILNYDSPQKQSQYTTINHEKIACISNINRRLYIVNFKNYTIEKFEEISNEVHSVCSLVDEFSVATSSSSVVVFRNFKKVCTCMSYREGISCCFSSSTFHISVIGTRDGFILINSIPSGELVRSIDMKEYRPQSILITPGWGFILVYATKIVDYKVKYSLQLFNINGGFLREKELDSAIVYMQTFTSRDGFDYILMSDDKNRVYLFEAFFLDILEPVTRFTSHICALRFFKDFDCLCIVGTDGKVSFLSCKIPNVL
ncbi:Beige/BEACH domain containing protein [Trichomonas vaginalis G3]|uniref:Beige/BEACH domain containing protein n=1 Tax=Trichomonas vaginalis (strain ATCC PRA-98 / G3) TaxID=412133 RepID=A2F9M0_TRIV3|nr:beige/BEACH-related family [Trichomonas vaginalis G3]EAX98401.1 Beige/BEACH domain containing protein [Trichomonas vaginalis G3]KAI5486586.1 beige/BEACH-related family [Trichomonas vaginalis G3]|eukprot:XP_001311331.1 Beige/BEACH domain containing protein [Trichomonas vaginalis G3]